MEVWVNGKRFKLRPQHRIGKGGEAEIFAFGKAQVLKIFKSPDHPDYAGQPQEQQQAAWRLEEHQKKLRDFPPSLPEQVVTPRALAMDRQQQRIVGYSMPYITGAEVLQRYTERSFRQHGVSQATVVALFQDLHQTITALHQAGVIIGDCNDVNILVQGTRAWLIDADSFQFGNFLCCMFTTRFVDPLLCEPTRLVPCLPYTTHSDWYAFTVMLMQCLLFVGPYGGVYRPTQPSQRIPHDARPRHRLTVFHPQVQYPRPALPYSLLPDDLLHYLHLVFERDVREPFPYTFLTTLHWQTCRQCGTEHARPACPQCPVAVPVAVPGGRQTTVCNTVAVQTVWHSRGFFLAAAIQDNRLGWLSYDQGQFLREDGTIVWQGTLTPQMHYRLCGTATLLGTAGHVLVVRPDQPPHRLAVDSYGNAPLYDANERHYYWITQGQLWRNDFWGPVYIGDVLAGQTQFWVGSGFGFGVYRFGTAQVAFVFDAQRRGVQDNVALPSLPGHWLQATCVFTDSLCWFLLARQVQGNMLHHCFLVSAEGRLLASAEATAGDGSWLGTLEGKAAAGPWLFAPTDRGIVRIAAQGNTLLPERFFTDTAAFVDSGCQLYASPQGLYVMDRQEIRLLALH